VMTSSRIPGLPPGAYDLEIGVVRRSVEDRARLLGGPIREPFRTTAILSD